MYVEICNEVLLIIMTSFTITSPLSQFEAPLFLGTTRVFSKCHRPRSFVACIRLHHVSITIFTFSLLFMDMNTGIFIWNNRLNIFV